MVSDGVSCQTLEEIKGIISEMTSGSMWRNSGSGVRENSSGNIIRHGGKTYLTGEESVKTA